MYTDNPVTWITLVTIAIIIGVWFAKKALDELDRYNKDNKDDKW